MKIENFKLGQTVKIYTKDHLKNVEGIITSTYKQNDHTKEPCLTIEPIDQKWIGYIEITKHGLYGSFKEEEIDLY